MRTVCAWCGKTLGGSSEAEERLVSHGICQDCLAAMWNDIGVSTKDFLASLHVPVLMVDGNLRVAGGTPSAPAMTGKTLDEMEGKLGGEVFECSNASLPGGCGRTIQCSGCVLRQTVTDTYQTGQSYFRVPATLKVQSADAPEAVAIFVTTEKLGDQVLLKVEHK